MIPSDAVEITPPAGGRGRRATAAPGCVRRAFRRLRAGQRPRRAIRAASLAGFGRGLRGTAGSAASIASIAEFGPSSCIASLATSAAMSLMRSRNSAFSMRSVAQELSACCWIALMSRCSLARSSRASAKLLLDRGLLAAQLLDRRANCRRSTAPRSRCAIPVTMRSAVVVGLLELIVLVFALGEQLALRREPRFEIVDAVAEHLGFLDLDDQLPVEIGDALAQVFDAAARLRQLARRGLGFGALLRRAAPGLPQIPFRRRRRGPSAPRSGCAPRPARPGGCPPSSSGRTIRD